jgi:UDP-N-acetylmuramate--alanine ligase
VRRLRSLGVKVGVGHARGNVAQADAVVVSSAVKADNPRSRARARRHSRSCRAR